MSKTQLRSSLVMWRRRERYRQRRLDIAHKRNDKARIVKWDRLHDDAVRMVKRRLKQIADARPLRHRAADFAETLVGVMEQGGNNVGPMVSSIIVANGGIPGEAWCGDFMAFVYRHVGSKAVTRSWAAVRLLGGVLGVKRTSAPGRGDLVRFTFGHVGMFDFWCDAEGRQVPRAQATHIRTIEGNTGASGAVSDSKTGGDGVYKKVRSKTLVLDYLRVTR